jgi:hypothetical protein
MFDSESRSRNLKILSCPHKAAKRVHFFLSSVQALAAKHSMDIAVQLDLIKEIDYKYHNICFRPSSMNENEK